jgi:hypothetical protein
MPTIPELSGDYRARVTARLQGPRAARGLLPCLAACTIRCVTQHRVVELRRLLDPRGRVLPSCTEDVAWLGGLLEVLSACRVGQRWERAAVRCETPGCTGPVALRRIGDACEWFCALCTVSGAVVGWRGTVWDLTALEQADAVDRTDAFVFTRIDELDAVRRLGLARELRLTLAMAQAEADYVIVPCSQSELEELTTALEPLLAQLRPDDRRLVDRFCARADAALLACEARTDEPPTVH